MYIVLIHHNVTIQIKHSFLVYTRKYCLPANIQFWEWVLDHKTTPVDCCKIYIVFLLNLILCIPLITVASRQTETEKKTKEKQKRQFTPTFESTCAVRLPTIQLISLQHVFAT